MIDFVTKLDEYTHDFLSEEYPSITTALRKLFGFTELVRKTTGSPAGDQPFPVVVNQTSDRSVIQVSLDDRYQFISWFRLPGQIGFSDNEDDLWGLREGKRQTASLRWIVAHRVEHGENLIIELTNHVRSILRGLQGYDFVFATVSNINADHEEIYTTELGQTVYEKHRLPWNIYAVDIDIEYIVCPVESSS